MCSWTTCVYTVMEALGENVMHRQSVTHSYPYDWRTKQPVILRASRQWFVNTAKVKTKALVCTSTAWPSPD
jgi:isoleucyl-tRNA synthetase